MFRVLLPRFWAVHLLALVAVGIAVALGYWQYGAWHAARVAAEQDLSSNAPVPINQAFGPDAPFMGANLGQPVTITGTWRNENTVYVSRNGGFWVLTPLAVGPEDAATTASAIFVVRGESKTEPVAGLPSGQATITGWLQPPEGDGSIDDDPRDKVLPQVRLADLVQHVDQDLYSGYAIQKGDISPGLSQVQPEALPGVGSFTGARNLFYAIEWWFFGSFAVFLWWRYVREEIYGSDAGVASVT